MSEIFFKKKERERDNYWKQTMGAGGDVREGWDNWVMGIKEGIWYNKHIVLYATDESFNSTPEMNNMLYVN